MPSLATDISLSEMTPRPASAQASGSSLVSEFETIIQPTRGWIHVNWRELFEGRELLYFLIWRDLKVRYKQAILGVMWVVLQPVMNMIMFTLVFGNAAGLDKRLPKDQQNQYSLFVFAALIPWQLFSTALTSGGLSLVNQQNIVKKIYFPRLYVPTAAVGGILVDVTISFVMVMVLAAFKHVPFSLSLLALPGLLLLALINGLGVAYLMSALTVKYRDFRFLIPFMSQVLMYASFVAFPPSVLENPKWRALLLFNPMYGVIAGFRKCILHFPDKITGFEWRYIASSAIGGIVLLLIGLFVFRRTERTFADIA